MTDIVDRATRSRMMSGIRGKDTQPEMVVRRALYARGLRFRLHDRSLPGRPDIVIKKHRVAIFVNGCFWHGHQGCRYFRLPATNPEFWDGKIAGNRARDARKVHALREAGWRVAVVWECAIRQGRPELIADLAKFITSEAPEVD